MRKSLIALSALVALSGCTVIERGSVGIIKSSFSGDISTDPQYGYTETRYPINGLRPSDANGVLLDDLDLVVSFKLDPTKVPGFYIQTKELDIYKDDAGKDIHTVGLKVLENIVKHAVQELTKQQSLVSLAANLNTYEQNIKKQAQEELDKGYPGVFQLVRININHFVPPAAILEQANKTAALRSEVERNVEEQKLIAQRTQLETSKALVEAQALRAAIDQTHLSAEQLTAWKTARAYEQQAAAMGASATKVISVTSKQ